MINALIVRQEHLPKSLRGSRTAQYVRMSTDYQQYSIENQTAVIAAYARAHDLSIIRTYADRGESGLTIKRRSGLTQLIKDVTDGVADFDHILVCDVSRWGRFQDADESAYYEFICKQTGIKVAYCAEQLENDGSLFSNVAKNLKRFVAAGQSQDLSRKVHAGACRFARLGLLVGGRLTYGLERVLVDENLKPKEVLKHGDRKYLMTQHVRIRLRPGKEVTVVRWIFQRFLQVRSEKAIACNPLWAFNLNEVVRVLTLCARFGSVTLCRVSNWRGGAMSV